MTFVQHDSPSTVKFSCCTEVNVADNQVEEGSEMFVTSSACHEVVASRDGVKVEDVRTETLKEFHSILGGEGGQGRTRFSHFNNMSIIFRC